MLLHRFWDIFTAALDTCILSGVVNGKIKFSQNSAEQFRFNMKVLFSLILPYCSRKNILFPK